MLECLHTHCTYDALVYDSMFYGPDPVGMSTSPILGAIPTDMCQRETWGTANVEFTGNTVATVEPYSTNNASGVVDVHVTYCP